jgi:hypothetical protein
VPPATDQSDTRRSWESKAAYLIVESPTDWQTITSTAPWRALIPQEPILYRTEAYALLLTGRGDLELQIVEKTVASPDFPAGGSRINVQHLLVTS